MGIGLFLLMVIIAVAVFIPNPSAFQYFVFRATLALAATSVTGAIGLLVVREPGTVQTAGSIGGALVIFGLVYVLDPIKQIGRRKLAGITPALAAVAPALAPERSIFICYRRADAVDLVGRLYDRLVQRFGDTAVFRDLEKIPAGLDYRTQLSNALSGCKVVIALIGSDWELVKDASGKRRLDDETDYVRLEIVTSLKRNLPVIPLLIDRTSLPAREQLPADLQDLVFRQFLILRHDPDFKRDVERIVENLTLLLAQK